MRIRDNLKKTAPGAYRTLVRLGELLRPAEMSACDAAPSADNDNNTGYGVDYRHDILPGADKFAADLLAAYADGMRSRVVVRRNGKVERFAGGFKFQWDPRNGGETVEIGGRSSMGKFFGMRFYRGELVAYAKGGKRERPKYEQGEQRGPDGDPWEPVVTTASAPRHDILAELDRADSAADLAQRAGPVLMERLLLVLEADSFDEIGSASGYAKSAAHRHGRRVAIETLKKIEKLAA